MRTFEMKFKKFHLESIPEHQSELLSEKTKLKNNESTGNDLPSLEVPLCPAAPTLEKYDDLLIPVLRQFISKLKKQLLSKTLTKLDFSLLNDSSAFLFEGSQRRTALSLKILSLFTSLIEGFPIISPFGYYKVTWDAIHFALIAFLIYWIPIEICFSLQLPQNVNLSIFLFFCFDILVEVNTAYYQNGFLNFQRLTIRHHYMKHYFITDLTTAMVFLLDLFLHSARGDFNFIGVVKILFFLRYKNLTKIYDKMTEILKLRRTSLLDLFNLFFFSYFILHCFACMWFLLAEYYSTQAWDDEVVTTWFKSKPNLIGESNQVKYLYSLYWATVTIMTVGYGDITASNRYEIAFTIGTIFIGCVVFAYIISSIGMIICEINKEKSQFKSLSLN